MAPLFHLIDTGPQEELTKMDKRLFAERAASIQIAAPRAILSYVDTAKKYGESFDFFYL